MVDLEKLEEILQSYADTSEYFNILLYHLKEYEKLKQHLEDNTLCESCIYKNRCIPQYRYGVAALTCNQYKKRKDKK